MSPTPAPTLVPGKEPVHPWFPFNAQRLMYGAESTLTMEEIGLYLYLRSWCWNIGPLPADEMFLLKRVAPGAKLSRYKFRKLFERVRNFFHEEDGFFTCSEDESERRRDVEISAKRRIAGILSAEARERRKLTVAANVPAKPSTSVAANGQQNANQLDIYKGGLEQPASPGPPGSPEEILKNNPSTLPPRDLTGEEGREAGGSLKKPQAKENTASPTVEVTAEEFQVLTDKCTKAGIAPASPPLAARLKKKLTNAGFPDWLKLLTGFENQKSAGLWESKTIPELQAQTARDGDAMWDRIRANLTAEEARKAKGKT